MEDKNVQHDGIGRKSVENIGIVVTVYGKQEIIFSAEQLKKINQIIF